MTTRRLRIALACFSVFALAGWRAIDNPQIRLALWIFLAGLALKSWIAWLKARDGGPAER